MKYDRAASKRRFHCSDSIDIELSSPSSFFRFSLFILYPRGAARLFSLPLPTFHRPILSPPTLRARAFSSTISFYVFPTPFSYLPFFFFNHISVSLSRYTRALASCYERCKLVCWNVSQLGCPELSFISLLFFLFFSSPPLRILLSRYWTRFPFPVTAFFLQHSFFLPLLLTIFPFFLQYLYLSASFLSFGGGWFPFHPFPQPPLEVNESRRLSSFTRHRFYVGRRRAANRVNSSPLVERGSVFPFHRGGAILPASKRPDLFTSIRSPLLIPLLRNRRFLACEWALSYPICFVRMYFITGMRRKNFLIRLICWNGKDRTWLIISEILIDWFNWKVNGLSPADNWDMWRKD